jgi:hypothetical protein
MDTVQRQQRVRRAVAVSIGNAGEHLVMAELLAQGFQAFMADRGNPAFDVAVDVGGVTSMIRVKTTTAEYGAAQWSMRRSGQVFLDVRADRDFVALVDLRRGVRGSAIYLVPTTVVDAALRRAIAVYLSHTNRNGTQRKDNGQRILRLDGEDRPDNPSFGFAAKWAQYREAWHQLPACEMRAIA